MKHFTFNFKWLVMSLLLCIGSSAWATDPDLTLDFTSSWTAGSDNSDGEKVFTKTVGTTTYTISGKGGANFTFNSGYFFFGKTNAYIKLPTVNFDVEKIEVVGSSGASGSVVHNLYVGNTAVSTAVTGLNGTTSTFNIGSSYQAAGTQYILKVTSKHNAQVTYIKYYKKPAVDLTSFAFANTTPSVTLSKSGSTFDASYSQAVTVAPAAYDGTITYSFDEVSSTFNLNNADIDGATGAIEISAAANIASAKTIVVKASATATDKYKKPSDATYTLTVNPAPAGVGTPEFSQVAGSYYYGTNFTISSSNSDKIFYTTDGTTPSKTNGTLYTGAITITTTMTVKAIGYDGETASEIGSVAYTLKAPEVPTFSVSAGGVTEGTNLELTMGDGGSKVVYTTDGTDPTASSNVYSSAITINYPMTIKAATVDAGNNLSTIVTNAYTIVVIKPMALWSENFSSYSANGVPDGGTYSYDCVNGGSDTKIYTQELADGKSPELLVGKTNGSFTAVVPLDDIEGTLTLKYKQNDKSLKVTMTAGSLSNTQTLSTKAEQTLILENVTKAHTSVTIKFEPTSSDNVRLDDIMLTYNKSFETTPATLSSNGYTTFASTNPLDLTILPAGVEAYKASVEGTTVTFTEIDQAVPANTGILLKGEASATVNIPVAASGTAVANNAFEVNAAGTTFTGDDLYYYFGLKKNTLTFALFEPSTVAIPANKAYLKVLKSSIPASAKSLNVVFDETTGISTLERVVIDNEAWYDLQGRKVAQPTKGIYIHNGKKIFVK